MKKVYVLLLISVFGQFVFGQEFKWGNTSGGSGSFTISHSTTADSYGNIYNVGSFEDTVDFDPGIGVVNKISNGLSDIFIQKLNSKGELVWVETFGDSLYDYATSVEVDNQGHLYVLGGYTGTIDFDNGVDTAFVRNTEVNRVMYILKLKLNGDFVSVKSHSIQSIYGASFPTNFEINNQGELFICGYFSDTIDFDPSSNVELKVGNRQSDVFITKFDSSGNFIWVKTFGDIGGDGGILALDNNNNIYVAGSFVETVDFDPDTGVYLLSTVGGGLFNSDIYVLKLNPFGEFIWAKAFGNYISDGASSLSVADLNSIYIAGNFHENVDFNPSTNVKILASAGGKDMFLQKLDSSGNLLWVNSYGGVGSDNIRSIDLDSRGNILIVGEFEDTVDFHVNGETAKISKVHNDGFMLKVDKLGVSEWIKVFPCNNGVFMNQVSSYSQEKIIVCGGFADTIDMDYTQSTDYRKALGSFDAMVLQFGPNEYASIDNKIGINTIEIFPNPSAGLITINATDMIEKIIIFNNIGEILITKEVNSEKFQIDLNQLSQGVYFIKSISTSGNYSTEKIVLTN